VLGPLENEIPAQMRETDQDLTGVTGDCGLVLGRRRIQSTRKLPIVQGNTLWFEKTPVAATLCKCERFQIRSGLGRMCRGADPSDDYLGKPQYSERSDT
jgi:hypothetical protein